MIFLIKNLETQDEETVDAIDVVLGTEWGDNKTILLLSDGSKKELIPADRYLVSMVVSGEDTPEPHIPTLEELKGLKLSELSVTCNRTITAGCDVTLTDGTKGHISMTEEDQINLMAAQAAVQAGQAGYPFHLDGELCKVYAAADIVLMATAATMHKLYHTTYCNHLNVWVRRCESVEEVQAIRYGAALPPDLAANMAEVLGHVG